MMGNAMHVPYDANLADHYHCSVHMSICRSQSSFRPCPLTTTSWSIIVNRYRIRLQGLHALWAICTSDCFKIAFMFPLILPSPTCDREPISQQLWKHAQVIQSLFQTCLPGLHAVLFSWPLGATYSGMNASTRLCVLTIIIDCWVVQVYRYYNYYV